MRYNLNVRRHKVLWLSLKIVSFIGQIPSALVFLYMIAKGLLESNQSMLLVSAVYLPVSVLWAFISSRSSANLWGISGKIVRIEGYLRELDDQLYIEAGDALVYLDRESAQELGITFESEWSLKLYERSGIVVCAQRIGY